ncbi:MAG: hypothetical protein ACI93R_002767 [Flavobacteriales bacterium]|jgi:uncharacterized protein
MIHDWTFFIFGGKSHLIFALLFGLSFHIIMASNAAKGVDYRARFLWRLFLLLSMGYLHSLLYSGDILQVLSICGVLLVLLSRASNKTLLIVGLVFVAQIPTYLFVVYLINNPELHGNSPSFYPLMAENFKMFAHASLPDLMTYNLFLGQIGKWVFFLETGRLWSIVGFFLIGNVLGRIEFFESIAKYTKVYLVAFVVLLLAYACFGPIASFFSHYIPAGSPVHVFNEIFTDYSNAALTFVLIIVFIICYRHLRLEKALNLLAPCGRMSLTLYLVQSLIGVPLYYGFGLGWYASIGQVPSLMIGIGLFVVQVAFAHLWFKGFYYGPMEWLWRSLTLMQRNVPMRRVG